MLSWVWIMLEILVILFHNDNTRSQALPTIVQSLAPKGLCFGDATNTKF